MNIDNINQLLITDAVKKVSNPVLEVIGEDIKGLYLLATIPLIPFTTTGSALNSAIKKWFENFYSKLDNKLNKNISNPTFNPEVWYRVIDEIRFKDLHNNHVSELLLEILNSSVCNKNEQSDYIKYINLIKNLFPKSLQYLYYVKTNKVVLIKNNDYVYHSNDDSYQSSIITEDISNQIQHSDNIIHTNITGASRANIIMSCNSVDSDLEAKYINDLQNAGLISNQLIDDDSKPLYFNIDGRYYGYNYIEAHNNPDNGVKLSPGSGKKIDEFKKYLIRENYQYYLTDLGLDLFDNFYTNDVILAMQDN